jgi:hypothetical protein
MGVACYGFGRLVAVDQQACLAKAGAERMDDLDSEMISPAILCDVILTEWMGQGRTGFEIRALRQEMELYYLNAGLTVPPELGDPRRLVPVRRLLEARPDRVSSVDPAAIHWRFTTAS